MTKKKSLAWPNCSEQQLAKHIEDWVTLESFANTIIFLEGEMGAGKSTFARILLTQLSPGFSSQGSPTFPLVQQYLSAHGHPIYHVDLYRLKNERELEDSGILEQIEEQGTLSLVEWPNLFQKTFAYWKDSTRKRAKKVIEITIKDSERGPAFRNYHVGF